MRLRSPTDGVDIPIRLLVRLHTSARPLSHPITSAVPAVKRGSRAGVTPPVGDAVSDKQI